MDLKVETYLEKIPDLIREFTKDYKLPGGHRAFKWLPSELKARLINTGNCANFAYDFIKSLDLSLIENYILIYEWEGIHTFLVINNVIYDADILCGIPIENDRKKIDQYFLKWASEFEFVLNEQYYIYNEKSGYKFNYRNEDSIEVIERIYTVKEYIDKFEKRKGE